MLTQNAPAEAALTRFRADLLKCGCRLDQAFGLCVSGGADSLALLLLAKAAKLNIKVATVDHRLRAESGAEAIYVASICTQLGLPHETLILGEGPRSNLSDWARRARYAALRAWAEREGIALLLTAHHADDQLETMLMRLNRGSGVAGLAGVRVRQADLCRPLLGWRKSELVALVNACGLTAIDDPTNFDDAYDRARLRKSLARIDWLDPQAAALSAAALADANDALDWAVQRLLDEHLEEDEGALTLALPGVPHELARRALLACIARLDPSAKPRGAALERLLATLQHGGTATLSGIKCSGGTRWRFTHARARRIK